MHPASQAFFKKFTMSPENPGSLNIFPRMACLFLTGTTGLFKVLTGYGLSLNILTAPSTICPGIPNSYNTMAYVLAFSVITVT